MKVIQPIETWYSGKRVSAVYFQLECRYDDLETIANFAYTLYDADMTAITSSVTDGKYLNMAGSVYHNWTDNDYAYNWAALPENLDLVILGEYTTTTTTTTETPV